VARFRLRFLLQELDLVGPEIVLGRSPDCQITIEDPLVSRQHARITIANGVARVMDLGSRNGVRINGNLIRGEATLAHNDRVRLGTQDLVFLVVDDNGERLARSTGYMMHCTGCGRPFPGESGVCPHCGAKMEDDNPAGYDTITGFVVEPQPSWTFQLLGEVIERALTAGRAADAERMFQRASNDIDERAVAGVSPDPKLLSSVGVYALRLAKMQGSTRWAEWALDAHQRSAVLPSADMLVHFSALDPVQRRTLLPKLEAAIEAFRGRVDAPSIDETSNTVRWLEAAN
jgi:hypothetical protein